ncbi:MAG: tetratricopeptide repeat protein [Bacteroides sp.]|jgi:tetratricopeptide (TPR) repeat protein|nr:tetratricopeptide repeat protein [Bacteroides sp.]
MSKSKKHTEDDKNILAVEEALSRSEQFIERNQNGIMWTVAIIVLLIAAYIGYTRFFLAPREKDARAEMFMAETWFEQDSLQLALVGNAEYPGFADIISSYRFTKSANLAHYYAGISNLKLGNYDDAIKHLKKFRGRDQIVGAMALGAIGDAYLENGDQASALRYYRKAYRYKPNDFTTPVFLFKAGLLFEEMGQPAEALALYERIRKEYQNSAEGRNIERYIGRTSAQK